MTKNLVTNTMFEEVLIQVMDGNHHFTKEEVQKQVSILDWECSVEGFFGLGEEYCLLLIQKGMKAWEKKAENSMEKFKQGEHTTERQPLVYSDKYQITGQRIFQKEVSL